LFEINKIYNEDCLKTMRRLPDESVDLIIADPPYYKIVKDEWDHQWDTIEEWIEWHRGWLGESKRVLKDTGSFYYYGGVRNIAHIKILLDEYFEFRNWITWHKKRGRGSKRDWLFTREELLFYTKSNNYKFKVIYSDQVGTSNASKKRFRETGRGLRLSNVWNDILEMGWNNTGKCKISAEKPVKIGQRIIESATDEGDLVYIPFAGSGSEIEASINCNRRYIASEINNEYIVNIINPRLQNKKTQ
jgi:site-specific DNA-methyltransferase (adenine-specific)